MAFCSLKVSTTFILCHRTDCPLILPAFMWESHFFLTLLFHENKKQSEEELIRRLRADVPSVFKHISALNQQHSCEPHRTTSFQGYQVTETGEGRNSIIQAG